MKRDDPLCPLVLLAVCAGGQWEEPRGWRTCAGWAAGFIRWTTSATWSLFPCRRVGFWFGSVWVCFGLQFSVCQKLGALVSQVSLVYQVTLTEPVHSLLTIQIACDILIFYLIFLINMYIVVFKSCVDSLLRSLSLVVTEYIELLISRSLYWNSAKCIPSLWGCTLHER